MPILVPMKYMGMDIGDKTIGIAISDALGFTAQPIETIRFHSPEESFRRIVGLVIEHGVTGLVPGLPLNMNGTEGPRVQKTKKFIESLDRFLKKKGHALSIDFWDERLSSVAAERALLEADLSRAKRKDVIDKMAAVHILQGYLESKRKPNY